VHEIPAGEAGLDEDPRRVQGVPVIVDHVGEAGRLAVLERPTGSFAAIRGHPRFEHGRRAGVSLPRISQSSLSPVQTHRGGGSGRDGSQPARHAPPTQLDQRVKPRQTKVKEIIAASTMTAVHNKPNALTGDMIVSPRLLALAPLLSHCGAVIPICIQSDTIWKNSPQRHRGTEKQPQKPRRHKDPGNKRVSFHLSI